MNKNLILDPSYFREEWLKTMVILQRPAVQVQLVAITISLIVMFLLSQWLWGKFEKRFPDISQFEERNKECYYQQCGAALLFYLLFPTFSLLVIFIINFLFLEKVTYLPGI